MEISRELIRRIEGDFRDYDVAMANLQSAVGLRGAEDFDVFRLLDKLDDIANCGST